MKFVFAPILALAAIVAALPAAAQSSPPPPAAPPQSAQPSAGKIIFSRSTDENGQTITTVGPAAPQFAGTPVTAPTATDAERAAVTFTALDLDVHLNGIDHRIAVRALLTLRNSGKSPLAHLPLQISSTLNWEHIRIEGRDVPFTVATLNSDTDHTGQLHEAAITLSQPLVPGATLQLIATYSGVITPSAQRLIALGTPNDLALHSDWDSIGLDFTGLRGFGNVVWYPVSSVPVILGDGARLFDEVGQHMLHMEGVRFTLRLDDEFPRGQAPTVVLINGHPAPIHIIEPSATSQDTSGFAIAEIDNLTLGFVAPSLFVAVRQPQKAENTTLWTLSTGQSALPAWTSSVSAVTPFLQSWLGPRPRSQLTVLDLPDPDDAPFETGALLATPIIAAPAAQLENVMVHALTHAFMETPTQSPPAWLDEGVAHFMGVMWLENRSGRAKALESLEAVRPALALDEPSSPGVSSGQPLAQAYSPVYYRTKAAYVFWMLRDLIGDDALSSALRAYNPTQDSGTESFERLLARSTRRDLSWFFADWIDADKGLPDLAIDSVFPSPVEAGNILVAVNLSNAGYASAEVPVTVTSALTSVTRRVLVPSRGKATERILIQGNPTQVQANDGVVPETQASVHIMKLSAAASSSSSSSQPIPPPQ